MRLNSGIIFSGSAEEVVKTKDEIENLLASRGLKLVYVRTTPRALFLLNEKRGEQDG